MSNSTPHISVNKLGEFIYASAAKKRSILKTMKYPSTFKLARYPEPQNAFVHFMKDADHNISVFEKKRNQVKEQQANTKWAKEKQQCCLQAIDQLIDCAGTILVPYLKYIADNIIPKEEQHTTIQNVTMHLKPDTILVDAQTKEINGAVKLVFSKNRSIDTGEGTLIAAAIKNHLETLVKIKVKPENCIVLDVFHKRKFTAPKFLQPSKMQMKLACLEIIELWPTIND